MQLRILTRSRDESSPPNGRQLRCRLYGHQIVDKLPRRCPLRTPNPIKAILEMQDLAWRCIGRWDGDANELADGLDVRVRCDICAGCIAKNSAHRKIKWLRAEEGLQR